MKEQSRSIASDTREFSPERLDRLAENLGLSEEEKEIINEVLQMTGVEPAMDQSSLIQIGVNRDVVEAKRSLARILGYVGKRGYLITGSAILSGYGGISIYSIITLNAGLTTGLISFSFVAGALGFVLIRWDKWNSRIEKRN